MVPNLHGGILNYLTEYFTTLKPHNPSIYELYAVVQKGQPMDFEALKL